MLRAQLSGFDCCLHPHPSYVIVIANLAAAAAASGGACQTKPFHSSAVDLSMPAPPSQVSTHPGEVIKPDSWKVIDGEGMPIEGSPYEKGNLYIQFDVKFPDLLEPAQVQALTQVRSVLRVDNTTNDLLAHVHTCAVHLSECVRTCCAAQRSLPAREHTASRLGFLVLSAVPPIRFGCRACRCCQRGRRRTGRRCRWTRQRSASCAASWTSSRSSSSGASPFLVLAVSDCNPVL